MKKVFFITINLSIKIKKVFFTTIRRDLQKLIKRATTYMNLKGDKEKTNKKVVLDSRERHISINH
jgi:hypothetical protein